MCQYSAVDGMPEDWHLVHLGARAVGGAGLVLTEATAVSPDGRISPGDTGIWSDPQAEAWGRIARFVRSQGAAAGVQLAHAGRKASTAAPWLGGRLLGPEEGGWQPVAPSPLPARPGEPPPRPLTEDDLDAVVESFVRATRRAIADFDVVEVHAAHGYLLHEFLSPLANIRTDDYGGSLENRLRLPLRVVEAVRKAWPDERPLFVRISATDWVEGGWDVDQAVIFARRLRALGVDLVDCSSGGISPEQVVPVRPAYQVEFATRIRREASIATGAVGLLTEPDQADEIVAQKRADLVLLARELLRDPYWPRRAASELGAEEPWPVQYERARPR
jgi:2,4-dienoyl-CoA reductase-like NADH-dependent reductase (Old Yellow Enzyme family)